MRNWAEPFYPLATIALLLAGWWVLVVNWSVSPLLLPTPDAVAARLLKGLADGDLLPHLWATLGASALGYAVGCSLAFLCAILFAEMPRVERALYPLVLGFQAIPKVAIAPLVFIWVGFGLASEVILVALIAFFPVFVNTFNAWRSVDINLVDLYRSLSASRLHIILNLKLPLCAGVVFSGLEIAVTFALTGCVVMEFITGRSGAGFVIENSASSLDTPLAMAMMVMLGILGLAAVNLVKLVRRKVVFWERSSSDVVPTVAAAGGL